MEANAIETVKKEIEAKGDPETKEIIELTIRLFTEKPETKGRLKRFMEEMLQG